MVLEKVFGSFISSELTQLYMDRQTNEMTDWLTDGRPGAGCSKLTTSLVDMVNPYQTAFACFLPFWLKVAIYLKSYIFRKWSNLNPTALRKTKIVHVYNFGLSECNMIKAKNAFFKCWAPLGSKSKMKMAEMRPWKVYRFTYDHFSWKWRSYPNVLKYWDT